MATDMATDMNIRAFNEEGTSYLYISAHADSEPVRVAVADCLSALQQAPTMLLCPDSRKHVHELHMRHRRHETLCTLKSARRADEVQRRVILDNMVGKLDGDNMSVPFVSEEDVRRVAPWPPLRDVLRQHGFVAKDLDCKDELCPLRNSI